MVNLPFDTAAYEELAVSAFIYEPILNGNGAPVDYRVVYANQAYRRDWDQLFPGEDCIGVLVVKRHVFDVYTLRMMENFITLPSHAFTTYIPQSRIHIHFQPMTNLPAPYAGFFLSNITDYEEDESRAHFLRTLQQMNHIAVLMRQGENGRLEAAYVSDAFAEMMECSPDEALGRVDGMGFLRIIHPEDRPLVRSMLKRHVSDEGKSDLTVQLTTTTGRHIWCNIHYSFINDFSEHYVYCTFSDVTVLKEYEERLRSVYMSLGSNFYQLNEQTLGLFRVNLTRDAIEDVKGRDLFPADSTLYPYSESMRRRSRHFTLEAERTRFLEIFDRKRLITGFAEGRTSVSLMMHSVRRDGRMCFVDWTAILTRHPMTGDVVAFITEKECNDEKVRESLISKILVRQFDMVAWLTDGHYGVTIGDAAHIKRGSIFPLTRNGDYAYYLESQVFPILSGTEEEKAEMSRALSFEEVEARLPEREPYVVNISCEIDGEIYYKRFDFYSASPGSRFYIILKSDTTEIQQEQIARNEQLRTALEEARQASVAKTAFLSSMSHEIRTPMNAIIGLDNIALSEPDLPAHSREHLEKIGVSARHLLGLINDILDMSRIESGRMTLKNEEFSFRDFLEQINTLVSSQCQDRGLQYHCTVQGAVDEYYIGDDMKLKQVLINILGNAVKFTPSPGNVSLTVERAAVYEDQSTLRFVIKDTGIGMDKDYLPKIFEAFSQENSTTTNAYGGSGLGMAITKNIVEMMNGNISVRSEKGAGSEFTVNVSLRNTDRTDLSEKQGEIHPQDLRTLVIDDDPVALEHAKLILGKAGIVSDTCQSGAEALELLRVRHARRELYNLILVDLKMPEQDGVEVTRKIRELYGNESAVIMLTAYNWSDIEEEATAAGVDCFMSKPLFAANILYEFRQALARRDRKEDGVTPEPADLHGRHILLAEDTAINAEIMLELLDMEGMTAEHAENGQEAVNLFTSQPEGHFDAVLMDIRMPVMDGLEAAAAIRALDRPDARTVPIIAMTANAFDEDVQRSLQAGMDAHLTKPVEPDRLYETLAAFMSKRQMPPHAQNSAGPRRPNPERPEGDFHESDAETAPGRRV